MKSHTDNEIDLSNKNRHCCLYLIFMHLVYVLVWIFRKIHAIQNCSLSDKVTENVCDLWRPNISVFQDLRHILLLTTGYTGAYEKTECLLWSTSVF